MELRKIGKKISNIDSKKAINLALAGGAIYIIYVLSKGLGKTIRKITSTNEEEVEKSVNDSVSKDMNNLAKEGVRQTISSTDAESYARTLKVAMDGSFWNPTDEDAIYRIFSYMKNDADILALTKAFGSRRMEFTTTYGDLAANLHSELTNKEIEKLNSILASNKNISIRY